MAIEIHGISSELTLTSQLSDVYVYCTSHKSLTVQLATCGGDVLLSERYYAAEGVITLRGLGQLCESALRLAGQSYGEFSLTAADGSEQADAVLCLLYCDRFTPQTDIPQFLAENFLTTCQVRRMAYGADNSLTLFAAAGESVRWQVSFTLRDPVTGAWIATSWKSRVSSPSSHGKITSINIPWSLIVTEARRIVDDKLPEIGQIVVYCGQRSCTFFVDDSLRSSDTFLFRNCFNAIEAATLPLLTTAKTAVEQAMAVVNGQARHYNRHASQMFEAETGSLLAQEARWLEQLVTSHEVVRLEPNSLSGAADDTAIPVPVLITDFTCEVHDGDDKPNTLKFTWRYADNRPSVRLSAPANVFTHHYNPTFA